MMVHIYDLIPVDIDKIRSALIDDGTSSLPKLLYCIGMADISKLQYA